jgi:sugar lactone lactonase YvrE
MMDKSPAPEFPTSLEWLNLAKPLRMGQLRGRVTALAFVNAGSAWCQQRLSDLATLRKRYAEHLHVVAIHVPRFDHERDPKRVIKRLQRMPYDFPIAHDAEWVLWQHYGIDAWPTVVLIDGQGRVRERIVGDTPVRELDAQIAKLRAEEVPQSLNLEPIELRRNREPDLPLRFPMGIAANQQYLYVVDSGHHRVLECTPAGRIHRQFGSGGPGFIDGPMELAAFQNPQGLCLQRDALYVADTGNHAVRRIKLSTGDVDTLCGAGRPGQPNEGVVHDPRSVALDQPRGVAVSPANVICIATAGDNKIWAYDLGEHSLRLLAGSGVMDLIDGEGAAAAFAGPSALAIVQQILYVCDEAGSAIRSVHMRTRQVTTLVGQGAWRSGNIEGSRSDALLQQPQALSLDGTSPVLWVADSGNDQLRTLRLGGGELSTISLPQRLHCPAGLAVVNGIIWIADTDAHAVLRFDPADGTLRQIPIGE